MAVGEGSEGGTENLGEEERAAGRERDARNHDLPGVRCACVLGGMT